MRHGRKIIRHGATWTRIGTASFGPRVPNPTPGRGSHGFANDVPSPYPYVPGASASFGSEGSARLPGDLINGMPGRRAFRPAAPAPRRRDDRAMSALTGSKSSRASSLSSISDSSPTVSAFNSATMSESASFLTFDGSSRTLILAPLRRTTPPAAAFNPARSTGAWNVVVCAVRRTFGVPRAFGSAMMASKASRGGWCTCVSYLARA